ncbi:MAG: vancomycin high temperature exclusion protein [Anaerolineales bacterium]
MKRSSLWTLFGLSLTGLGFFFLPRMLTTFWARGHIFGVDEAPERPVAIVFGAGLQRDGHPTLILRDRVRAAAELYFAGKVRVLLLSGDNRFVYYNEPAAMREYALSLGVPDEALVLDYAGRRTYDTCYRARDIFGVREALLVTQDFHLPRALFICRQLGIQAEGVSADLSRYRRLPMLVWDVRENLATLGAFWDVFLRRPLPVLGKPEPIEIGR